MRTPNIAALLAATAMTLAWGCSVGEERLGIESEPPPGTFGSADGGPDAAPDPNELVTYCPSSTCPPGWTTCPSSRFPCDVNLLADPSNCGACGAACPKNAGVESFSCVEGACGMQCDEGALDCDGLVDNGCEARDLSNFNCGGCGNKCPSDTACVWQDVSLQNVGCGCPPGKINCGYCMDLTANDSNCGACGNACDKTGGPEAPQYPNVYYGCSGSTCGYPKCKPYFQDCDAKNENGCETSLVTDESCGGCGSACPAGQHCYLNGQNAPECMCTGDLTFCDEGTFQDYPQGHCADVRSAVGNCGACGVSCAATGAAPWTNRSCDYGACVSHCQQDHADCNGNEADGCEIDTRSDPRNCGGCGVVCDAVAGQACVAGKCVVEPCNQLDAGEVTR